MADKKNAKLAIDKKGPIDLPSRRRCGHCGELIAVKDIVAVERTAFRTDNPRKSTTKMVYYTRGHESSGKAA